MNKQTSIEQVYNNAKVVNSGKHFTTVNELTDQIPALRPSVLWEAALELCKIGSFNTTKIVSEEDKGVSMAVVTSLITGLPLALARWYPYSLDGISDVKVPIDSEYFTGSLYLNGINPGDRVTIVDDTLATGGTVIALVKAIRKAGATVEEILFLVEKTGVGGRERIQTTLGLEVKSVMKIEVSANGVSVVSRN